MAEEINLHTPGRGRRRVMRNHSDGDSFGRIAEAAARFMGTGKFIVGMTIFIIVWVVANITIVVVNSGNVDADPWDPYPFILLNLCFSTQASYAAPLILVAQNRQEARDRVSLEHDRQVAAQSRADTDFLARELAALRLRVNDLATRDFIRSELRNLLEELEEKNDAEH
ncbi:MAG: DUF1003 domain-containing protein [Propionibacteriaceae bacterium]|jgi:uncharacterized membrane protein|nr:DUF1003 domain-containing protein [Propionibacteriaceae bacterium]